MKKMYPALLALLVTLLSFQGRGQTVSGPSMICTGSSGALSGTPAGGTWQSGMPAIATINMTTGVVTGTSSGVAVITYNSSSGPAFYPVTVNPLPPAIGGTATLCVGSTTTLTDGASGGTWSSANPAVATVGAATGIVTGNTVGTATISYVLATGCLTTKVVTVNPLPAAITGSTTIPCSGTTTLSDVTPGGTWSSSNITVATVSATGVVTGISGGTTTISYTLGTSCSRTVVVTVTGSSSAGTISGPSTLCVGSTTTYTSTVSGGTWTSVFGSASITSGGVATGVSAGIDTLVYTVSGSCGTFTATYTVIVGTAPTAGTITGTLGICAGMTSTLGCTPAGGTWTTSTTAVAPVGSTTGVVTGITAGTATISYTVSSACGSSTATAIVTVNPIGTITGGGGFACMGSTITLSSSVTGGTWSTASPAATIGASSGILTGVSFGVATITYVTPGGCVATTSVTVNTSPSLTATATAAACGPMYTGVATGASTYTWSPATGVTCSTCATTNISVSSTTTYTVTGSNGTCSTSSTVTVNGDRINGHIFFGSVTPASLGMKVWLIQFDPTDSSITAQDSTSTCLDSGIPYYEFASKPAGSYLVKAKLLSSVAGTSDYIPTYGASTPYWYSAAAISHTSATNTQNITMIYGTVPAGPGFISGYVVSGAGKGTSGDAPVAGMLIYLKKASTGEIVTYTYTDATGAYSFGSLGYGNYVIYPEAYDYYTTPSSVIALSASSTSATATNFKMYTTSHTIKPYSIPNSIAAYTTLGFHIYPNPADGFINIGWGTLLEPTGSVVIKDLTGRTVLNSTIAIDPTTIETSVNIGQLPGGVYFITVKNGSNNHTEKLIVE